MVLELSKETRQAAVAAAEATTAQGPERINQALDKVTRAVRIEPIILIPGIAAWVAFAAIAKFASDSSKLRRLDEASIASTTNFTAIVALVIAISAVILWGIALAPGPIGRRLEHFVADWSAWFLGAGLWFVLWELLTAKTAVADPPYFAAPQAILDRLWRDRVILSESLGNSLQLLAVGFIVGLIAGLATGLAIGWWQSVNYWVNPVLIFIGPVPALAWVPVTFVTFPSAYSGAVFLIALTVWFPISILTRAGILSVPRSYYDVASTLGAKSSFLILRVSLPAALPSIFTGAFMALGSSFATLTVAENFGVNSGLGWYLNWKKSWGDFPGVYAGIVILVLVCGLLLILLFRIRSWALRWEKELTRW